LRLLSFVRGGGRAAVEGVGEGEERVINRRRRTGIRVEGLNIDI
jgi:hypothetical protein